MPDEPNYANVAYADSPELQQEFGAKLAGDDVTFRVTGKVIRNEDNSLTVDITEIVLPELGPQPVTQDSSSSNIDETGGSSDPVSTVLQRERPARGELDDDEAEEES
jgi:hypothetical protein